MRKISIAFSLFAILALGGCGDDTTPMDGDATGPHERVALIAALTGDAATGAALYAETPRIGCFSCHGDEGEGGPLGPALTGRISALTNDQMADVLMKGVPATDTFTQGMISYEGILDDQEAADIVAHLRAKYGGS